MTTAYQVNVDAINKMAGDAQDRAQARMGAGTPGSPAKDEWLKLDAGDHLLRIAPPWDEQGLVFVTLRQHRNFKNDKGWTVFPLSFDQIFSDESLVKYLLGREMISQSDYQLYKKHGCPFKILPKTLQEQGVDPKEISQFWPRTRHIANIAYIDGPNAEVYQGTIKKMGISDTLFTQVIANLRIDPTVADAKKGRPFLLNATGPRDMTRRYNFMGFQPDSRALKLDKGETPFDLMDELTRGVYTFEEAVKLVANSNTKYPISQRLGDLA